MSAPAQLAISCTDVEVHYTVRAHRPLIRDMLRGQRPAAQYIEAVRGVTFDVHVGESVGVVGPNGSGKTTLLQATTGLVPLAGGTCRVRSIPTFLGVSAVLRNTPDGWRYIHWVESPKATMVYIEDLFEKGVAAIYGPGTNIPVAAAEIMELIQKRKLAAE